LLARAGSALRVFFALRFFEAFFPAVATTNSFIGHNCRDCYQAERYRVASASIPNTEKTSGFRSKL
jgi:hypothetical protein